MPDQTASPCSSFDTIAVVCFPVVCSHTMYTFENTNSAPNYYCFRQYGQFVITRLSEPYTFSQLIKPHHFTFNWEIECTHMFV